MKISVLMTTYNGNMYITEQMDSLRKQTRKIDNVIIVDDCSEDLTVSIIKEYIEKNSLKSWKLIENSQNVGWRYNFWKGLNYIDSDLVLFCDQDDIWHRDKVRIMEKAFEEKKGMIALACRRLDFCVSETDKIKHKVEENIEYNTEKIKHIDRFRNSLFTFSAPGCALCVKMNFLREIDKYWKESFEYDLYIRVIAQLVGELYVYDDILLYQRIHLNNATKRGLDSHTYDFQKKDSKKIFEMTESILQYAKEKGQKGQIIFAKKSYNWSRIRYRFYEKRSLLDGVCLLFYLDCFPRYKQIADDFRYVYNVK